MWQHQPYSCSRIYIISLLDYEKKIKNKKIPWVDHSGFTRLVQRSCASSSYKLTVRPVGAHREVIYFSLQVDCVTLYMMTYSIWCFTVSLLSIWLKVLKAWQNIKRQYAEHTKTESDLQPVASVRPGLKHILYLPVYFLFPSISSPHKISVCMRALLQNMQDHPLASALHLAVTQSVWYGGGSPDGDTDTGKSEGWFPWGHWNKPRLSVQHWRAGRPL